MPAAGLGFAVGNSQQHLLIENYKVLALYGTGMSAQATPNGIDLRTMDPIAHDYDSVGDTVLAACVACSTETTRRLLRRDYDDEDEFKQSLVEGNDDWIPTAIWRRCDECGEGQTHFVC